MDWNKIIADKIAEIEQDKTPAKEYPMLLNHAKYCDHTVLRAYTPVTIVDEFCKEGIEHGAASICVNPIHVARVKKNLEGTDVKTCCVVGFPLGANRSEVKAFETKLAVEDGADEIDMVINIGALRDKNYDLVYNDIKAVVDASGEAHVKVIIECCYLTKEEKIAACVLSKAAGADYVKTSTGMGTGGATVPDVQLMKRVVGEDMLVKAATGILCREDVEAMVKAGAVRMGTSSTVRINTNDPNRPYASQKNQPPKFD